MQNACTEAASSITFTQLHPKSQNDPPHPDSDHTNHINQMPNQMPKGDYVGITPPHIQVGICPNPTNLQSNDISKKSSHRNPTFLPPYQIGLIATKGPHIMNGYWNRNQTNDNPPPPNHWNKWFITSDLGYLDEHHRLYFYGRANDVIRTGGETVFASEVERIIRTHVHIKDCVIVALPDDRFGEMVSAAILLQNVKDDGKSDAAMWLKTIRYHCAEHQLAGYKQPRMILILDDFPRNSSGKILKWKMKEMFLHSSNSITKSKL